MVFMMATHYQQRASAGLIITESSPVSPQAIGYPFTPGLYTNAHVEGWRRVTDEVHGEGGHIFFWPIRIWCAAIRRAYP